MLPENASNVLSIRPGFASEARRIGGEFDRQSFAVDDIFAINVRYRDLRCWNQIKIRIPDLKQVLLEFGQIARPEKTRGVRHERRQNFLVAVFLGMDVEHEVHERSLET